MKRQLGSMLAVLALFCAPLAWSQSGSSDGGSSSASTPSGTTSSGSTPSAGASSDSTSAGGISIGSASSGSTNGGGIYSGTTSNDPYFQVASGGQDGSSPSQDGQDSPDDTQSNTGPQSTFNHPELLPPITAITEVTHNTGLALSLNTGSLSNYVWGGHGQPSYWQNIGMWSGGIAFSQIRPTSLIQLGYTGGVSLSALTFGSYSNYTNLNQSGNARILWNFAKRWQMRIKDTYLYSDNPFEPFLTYASDPTPNQPNPTVYFPQAVIEQNIGSVDISYRLTAHDSFTINGSESLQNYIRGTTGLWDSYTWGGGAFFQHVFNPQVSAGVGYNFSALDFGHGQSRSGVQMIEGFVTYKFSRALSVSGWVGPEYTTTKDLIPIYCNQFGCLIEEKHNSEWDVAEGGTLAYTRSGNSIRVQTSHRVTDGGGVLGAVNLYQFTLAYSRPINRTWGFAAAVMYDNSVSVSHYRANQYWDATEGTINFSRKFGESWNGAVYLLFINQSQNFYGTPGTTSTAGLGLTLRYVWGHSLGR
jgi:hypothetical protein